MIDLANKRWVYYLDKTIIQKDCYRVSIIIENEHGHYPTGGNDREPWYWDEETCVQQNLKLGFDEYAVMEIVSSSMFPPSTLFPKKKAKNV